MMENQISKYNYEVFFLDYWEGNLNDLHKKQLADFLDQYPQLQNEFLDFKNFVNFKLQNDEAALFPNHELLKRTEIKPFGKIDELNYEKWIIASLENDLTYLENKELSTFLKLNKHLNREVDLFRLTFLNSDNQILYPKKADLKHRQKVLIQKSTMVVLSLAAVILLLLAFFILPETTKTPEMEKTVEMAEIIMGNNKIENTDQMNQTLDNSENKPTDFILLAENIDYQSVEQEINAVAEIKVVVSNESKIEVQHYGISIEKLQPIFPTAIYSKNERHSPDYLIASSITDMVDFVWKSGNETKNGVVKRIATNIGRQIFTVSDRNEEPASLLVEVAQKGIETFQEIKDFSNINENTGNDQKTEAVFALSERLAIRITRGNRQLQNDY